MKAFIINFFALSIVSFLIVASALFLIDSKQNGFSTLILNPRTTVSENNGRTIQLFFTAKENYLGTVDLPLTSPKKGNISFKIKEKDAKQWYYENKFPTEQFNILSPYPFGFPIIHDSKDKEYLVRVDVLDSAQIFLSKEEITIKSVFPKETIMGSKTSVLGYIFTKYYYILLATPILLYSMLYI